MYAENVNEAQWQKRSEARHRVSFDTICIKSLSWQIARNDEKARIVAHFH